MFRTLSLGAALSIALWAQTQMPPHQTYYIGGVAFDTRTYCADFAKVIEAQAEEIRMLKKKLAYYEEKEKEALVRSRKAKRETKEKTDTYKKTSSESLLHREKNRMIISDKPLP